MPDLAWQHAQHMGLRYGDASEFDTDKVALRSSDVFTKRMAMFGRALGEKGGEGVARIIDQIDRSDTFRDAVLLFDALHYTDLPAHDFLHGEKPSTYRHSATQILLQIISAIDVGIIDFNIAKLLRVIDKAGLEPFLIEKNRLNLHKALDRVRLRTDKTSLMKRFVDRTSAVLKALDQ